MRVYNKLKSFLLCCSIASSLYAFEDSQSSLPGRVNSEGIWVVRLGECDLYFYMTPEKHALAKKMIQDVNEKMSLTFGKAALPCPTDELLVQAIKYPERDPEGTAILDEYAKNVKRIAEEALNIEINGTSRYMNLNLNWEALKLHQDRFYEQYRYLSEEAKQDSKYTLIQDLTLIDWQMSKNTVSATMVQDGPLGDRFLICFFPNDVVGSFYTEPALCVEEKTSVSYPYPGHITMPPHSTVPPMDMDGSYTSGSSKGKRMSTATRGVVCSEQIKRLRDEAKELPVNRRVPFLAPTGISWEYQNGVTLKSLPEKTPFLNVDWNYKYEDRENVSIISVSSENNRFLIDQLSHLFTIDPSYENIQIKRLTKKDGGFSRIDLMDLEIEPNSRIILMNSSQLPLGYRHFNLAEDGTKKGLPWIQLFYFPSSLAMEVPFDAFMQMALTPVEELLFRDEKADSLNGELSTLMKKLVTNIDIFIFSKS